MDFNDQLDVCIVHVKVKVIKIVVFNRLTELISKHECTQQLVSEAFI